MLVISKRYYKTASIKETPSGRCGYLSLASNPNLPLTHSIRKAFFIFTTMVAHNMIDLTGQKFGMLTVLSYQGSSKGHSQFLCKCDCGKEKMAGGDKLKKGAVKSCGCIMGKYNNLKHGHHVNYKPTPEYSAWMGMKSRCYNTKIEKYKNHGGCGVVICKRWLCSFENFLADMGLRPSPKHSLDRFPNKNGNYTPSNCRWATIDQQNRNKRNNVFLKYNGGDILQKDFLKLLKIDWKQLMANLKQKKTPDQIAQRYIKQ